MERAILFFMSAVMALMGCSSRLTSTGPTVGKYSEDLSVWRPEVTPRIDTLKAVETAPERIRTPEYVEPQFAVNEDVEVVLDSIYDRNFKEGYIDGYTIQIYSGIRREEALNVKKEMALTLPEMEAEVQYRQPNFRVRSGQYYTRLEAQQDYLSVKRHFPNAIVIPDRIRLR